VSIAKYKIFFINDNEDGGVLIKAKRHDCSTAIPLALITNRQIMRHEKWIDAMNERDRIEFITTTEIASILRKGDVILLEKKL